MGRGLLQFIRPESIWRALLRFQDDTYWKGVWIFQETVLAGEILFTYSQQALSLFEYHRLQAWLRSILLRTRANPGERPDHISAKSLCYLSTALSGRWEQFEARLAVAKDIAQR